MAVEGMADFVVSYDGPAVEGGHMPVRELAPSLLALADLVQEVNAIAAEAPSVSLDIRATDRGSFDVNLVLAAVAGVLASEPITAASNIVTLTSASLDLLKRIRARAIIDRSSAGPGQIRIVLDDHTEITAPGTGVALVERRSFRENARGFVRPVELPGVEDLRIIVSGQPLLDVRAQDAPAFAEPSEATRRLENESQANLVLTVASLSFLAGNEWRLDDGSNILWYSMNDARFFAQVKAGLVEFRNGDTLTCRVRFQQWREALGGLKIERQIVEVLNHVHADTPRLFSP